MSLRLARRRPETIDRRWPSGDRPELDQALRRYVEDLAPLMQNLDRIRGHWGIIITLDFMFHWLIPFTLLLSRDLKRNQKRLTRVCQWMIFAKAFDLFWLIEPNFPDAARNLHFSWGILEYIAVPTAMVAIWFAFFARQLKARALVQTNDPHLAEILEPEHAHA